MPTYDKPIRKNVLENLANRFKSQRAGVSGATITWDFVSRDPLTENQKQEGYSLGIYPTTERTKELVGWNEKFLTVVFEFHVKIRDGDSPSDKMEDVLAEVQRVIFSDITCSGFTVNIIESGADTDIGLPSDRIAYGGVAVQVRYRHRSGDPYSM